MDRDTKHARDRLVTQWQQATAALKRLRSTAEVRPNDAWNTFRDVTSPGSAFVEFEVGPLVFNLPERANAVQCELFVVVQGRLALSRAAVEPEGLMTDKFSTKVAYFRQTTAGLDHIYGAHHDFARDELGHPVFHSQMRSFADLRTHVVQQYGVKGDLGRDCVEGVLRTVRLPSAQMDIFSTFLQLCADHLLFKQSGKEERTAFDELLRGNTFLRGAGSQVARLVAGAALVCYRAGHWYPVSPA
jgi:hypothetical protein